MKSRLSEYAQETGQTLTTDQLWEELYFNTLPLHMRKKALRTLPRDMQKKAPELFFSDTPVEDPKNLASLSQRIKELFQSDPEKGVSGLLRVVMNAPEDSYNNYRAPSLRRCIERLLFQLCPEKGAGINPAVAGHASLLLCICYLTELFRTPPGTQESHSAAAKHMRYALDKDCILADDLLPYIQKYEKILWSYKGTIYDHRIKCRWHYAAMERLYSKINRTPYAVYCPFILKRLAGMSARLCKCTKEHIYTRKFLRLCPSDKAVSSHKRSARKRIKRKVSSVLGFIIRQLCLSIPAFFILSIVHFITNGSVLIASIAGIISLLLLNHYVMHSPPDESYTGDDLMLDLMTCWFIGRM